MAEAINEMERRLAESNPHASPNAKTEDFKQQPPSVKPAGKRHRTSPAPRKTDEDTKTAAETPSQQAEEPGSLKPEGRSASFRNPHGRSWPMRHSPSYCKPSDCSSWSSYPCWQGRPRWRSSAFLACSHSSAGGLRPTTGLPWKPFVEPSNMVTVWRSSVS